MSKDRGRKEKKKPKQNWLKLKKKLKNFKKSLMPKMILLTK
jgi:hypothetical protein